MKLLNALLNEAKQSELDPSQVTASDVSAYLGQVKRALKGKQITKGSVGAVVRDLAEDDPKFGANPKALPKLISAICAKLCESIEASVVNESFTAEDVRAMFENEEEGFLYESDEEHSQPAKFSASSSVGELKAQAKYLKVQMAENKGNRVMHIKLKQALQKIEGFLAKKNVSESVENLEEKQRIDVDELSVSEIQAKLLAAAKAGHPGVEGMKVHADDKMMRVEVPGKDRCYATVSLTTGVVTVLKEGWDSEVEEEEEEAPKAKKKPKISPRAEAVLTAKAKKAVKETIEEPQTSEPVATVTTTEVPAKKVGTFMQAMLDSVSTSK